LVKSAPHVLESWLSSLLGIRPGTSLLMTLMASLTQFEHRSVLGSVLLERPPLTIFVTTLTRLFSDRVPAAPWTAFKRSVTQRLFDVVFLRQTMSRATG